MVPGGANAGSFELQLQEVPHDTGDGAPNNEDDTGVVDEPADVSWMVVQAGTHTLPGGLTIVVRMLSDTSGHRPHPSQAGKEDFTPAIGSGFYPWEVKPFETLRNAYSFASPPATFAMVSNGTNARPTAGSRGSRSCPPTTSSPGPRQCLPEPAVRLPRQTSCPLLPTHSAAGSRLWK